MKMRRDLLNQCSRSFHLEVGRQKHSSMLLERKLSNFLFKYPSALNWSRLCINVDELVNCVVK